MNPWYAKALILAGSVAMIIIRAPHGHRSRKLKVAKSRKGPLEVILLTLAWLGFFVPLVWVSSPAFAAAEIPLHPLLLAGGAVFLCPGPMALPSIPRGPWWKLVDHPGATGRAPPGDPGGLPSGA